jgi:AcrR family transcriptional regulator
LAADKPGGAIDSAAPATEGNGMSKTRMSSGERRAQIVAAARRVFSQHGYDGAKTLQIAREAGVSEALVYRHYPSKLALYRAVLRQIFQEQDERWRQQGFREASSAGLADSVHRFICDSISDAQDPERLDSHRMTLASLAGDGSYASLIYRRSQRRNQKAMEQAFGAASKAGDLAAGPVSTLAAAMFIEHVGTMIAAIGALPPDSQPYGISGNELARQATWFCLRGIGMSDEAIRRILPD